jgi:Tfp pilus assembly protein PilF
MQFDFGMFLFQHGKSDEAAAHFTAALADDPDFAEARHYLDQALNKTNNASPSANHSTP